MKASNACSTQICCRAQLGQLHLARHGTVCITRVGNLQRTRLYLQQRRASLSRLAPRQTRQALWRKIETSWGPLSFTYALSNKSVLLCVQLISSRCQLSQEKYKDYFGSRHLGLMGEMEFTRILERACCVGLPEII